MDFNNPKNIQHELKWNVYEPVKCLESIVCGKTIGTTSPF